MNTTQRPDQSPDAARLALKLVEWHYGRLCKDVMSALIKYGRQTLREIHVLSKIPIVDIRTALLVLLQQNCACSYMMAGLQNGKEQFVYEADLGHTLQILRMPYFLERISKEFHGKSFAPIAHLIVQALLFNGRLRFDQMAQAVAALKHDSNISESVDGVELFHDGNPNPEMMKHALRALIKERFIERSPPCTLPVPATRIHMNAQKRRGSKDTKTSDEQEAFILQAERDSQWREYWHYRFEFEDILKLESFEIQSSEPQNNNNGTDANGGKRATEDDWTSGRPMKRARGAVKPDNHSEIRDVVVKSEEEDDGTLGLVSMISHTDGNSLSFFSSIAWRVNYLEFNRRFRNDEVINLVKSQKYPSDGLAALEALLFASLPKESSEVSDEMPRISVNEVLQASKRLHGKSCFKNAAEINESLGAIVAQSSDQLVSQCGNLPLYEYEAGVAWALGSLRRAYIRTEVHKRFGSSAQRIWNMLFEDGQMEQKMIADKAMVQPQEARKALFAMLRDGFISLQDIPKSADRAPSRTVYTFRATLALVRAQMGCMLYKSAGNLVARLEKEMLDHADLLERVKLVTEGSLDGSHLDVHKVAEVKAITSTLMASLVRLDSQIALFCDYGV